MMNERIIQYTSTSNLLPLAKNSQQLNPYMLVMGPNQSFLTRVRSGHPSLVWVWIWKISPKNLKFFNFFPFRSKKNIVKSRQKVPGSEPARPLIYYGSKVCPGQFRYGTISSTGTLRMHSLYIISLTANLKGLNLSLAKAVVRWVPTKKHYEN